MWYLTSKNITSVHYLFCGEAISVSRQSSSHIYLPNDKSISRDHATITVLHERINMDDPRKKSEVVLQDTSSKYGTFVNGGIENNTQITKENVVQLREGDELRFGLLQNTWKLCYEPIVATSSQLKDCSELSDALLNLGGFLMKDYTSECSYLVMNGILLTAKTVCALASAKPIVTPKYFVDLLMVVRKKQCLPSTKDYLPPLKEASINKTQTCFLPNPERQHLFEGKTFIFCTQKSFNKLENVVKLAGGTSALLSNSNQHLLCNPNVILVKGMDKKTGDTAKLVDKAIEILKKSNLNAIPESDLGLAIVYVSTDKYCNPNFDVSKLLKRGSHGNCTQKTQSLKILATETQAFDDSLFVKPLPTSRNVIMETAESKTRTPSDNHKNKPTLSSQEETCLSMETQPFHSESMVTNMDINKSTSKRVRSEDEEDGFPADKKAYIDEPDKVMSSIQTISGETFRPPFCSTQNNAEESLQKQRLAESFQLNISVGSFDINALGNFMPDDTNSNNKRNCIESHEVVLDNSVSKKAEEFALPTVVNRRKRSKICPEENKIIEETPTSTETEFQIPIKRSRHARAPPKPLSEVRLPSPVKVEPVPIVENVNESVVVPTQNFESCKVEVKKEAIDVNDLSNAIEKSLVVVVVADLVISPKRVSPSVPYRSNGLPNFKRFTKNSSQMSTCGSILPRIVGGMDLVPHHEAHTVKDDFISSQPSMSNCSIPTQPTAVDDEFALPMIRSRVKTRMR